MPPKKSVKNIPEKEQRALLKKSDDTEYGLVTKKLGGGRFTVRLNMQNKEVIGRLCGKFRKGAKKATNWVNIDTVVLVGLRDFQDNTVDIVYVYDSGEVRQLRKLGEFVEESVRPETDGLDIPDEDTAFDFDEI